MKDIIAKMEDIDEIGKLIRDLDSIGVRPEIEDFTSDFKFSISERGRSYKDYDILDQERSNISGEIGKVFNRDKEYKAALDWNSSYSAQIIKVESGQSFIIDSWGECIGRFAKINITLSNEWVVEGEVFIINAAHMEDKDDMFFNVTLKRKIGFKRIYQLPIVDLVTSKEPLIKITMDMVSGIFHRKGKMPSARY